MEEILLLTAVSYKPHGACFAGIRGDGSFVRPVLASNSDLSIPWSRVDGGPSGRQLRPLDVVAIDFKDSGVGSKIHPEDWEINPNSDFRFVASWSPAEIENQTGFIKAIQNRPWFMHQNTRYVTPNDFKYSRNRASLAIVRVRNVQITPRPHQIGKYDIDFDFNGIRFDGLRLTALNREYIVQNHVATNEYWLCMSIGLDLDVGGELRNYKLVAGVWPVASSS